jgi:hypothetical protein
MGRRASARAGPSPVAPQDLGARMDAGAKSNHPRSTSDAAIPDLTDESLPPPSAFTRLETSRGVAPAMRILTADTYQADAALADDAPAVGQRPHERSRPVLALRQLTDCLLRRRVAGLVGAANHQRGRVAPRSRPAPSDDSLPRRKPTDELCHGSLGDIDRRPGTARVCLRSSQHPSSATRYARCQPA